MKKKTTEQLLHDFRESRRRIAQLGLVVLVVESEENRQSVTRAMLDLFGFGVLVAVDAREAVRVFHQNRKEIIAVLIDEGVLHSNGDFPIKEMLRLKHNVPLIVCNSFTEHDTQQFAGSDLVGFIRKTSEPSEFMQRLVGALETHYLS